MGSPENNVRNPHTEDNTAALTALSRLTALSTWGGLTGMVSGIVTEGVWGIATGTAIAPLVGTVVGFGIGVTVGIFTERRGRDKHTT